MSATMTAEEACAILHVSRETKARLETYAAILTEWQNRMNLVSRATLPDLWHRHILDCGQVVRHFADDMGENDAIMDIGSGAGLPGLVIAAILADSAPKKGKNGAKRGKIAQNGVKVILVESNHRKCGFLAAAVDAMGLGASTEILPARSEDLPPSRPAIITARAVAPLQKLLRLTRPQQHPGLVAFFFKGKNHQQELTCLADTPYIKSTSLPSLSDPAGAVIRLTGFRAPDNPPIKRKAARR